jgi:hypothetical protein
MKFPLYPHKNPSAASNRFYRPPFCHADECEVPQAKPDELPSGNLIWRFPKMWVTPNHPKLDYFSIDAHGDLGIPYFKKPPFFAIEHGPFIVDVPSESWDFP